jgi:hypothetical protein
MVTYSMIARWQTCLSTCMQLKTLVHMIIGNELSGTWIFLLIQSRVEVGVQEGERGRKPSWLKKYHEALIDDWMSVVICILCLYSDPNFQRWYHCVQ